MPPARQAGTRAAAGLPRSQSNQAAGGQLQRLVGQRASVSNKEDLGNSFVRSAKNRELHIIEWTCVVDVEAGVGRNREDSDIEVVRSRVELRELKIRGF